jgi:hypothetical protein
LAVLVHRRSSPWMPPAWTVCLCPGNCSVEPGSAVIPAGSTAWSFLPAVSPRERGASADEGRAPFFTGSGSPFHVRDLHQGAQRALQALAAVVQRATAAPWRASASRRRPPLWAGDGVKGSCSRESNTGAGAAPRARAHCSGTPKTSKPPSRAGVGATSEPHQAYWSWRGPGASAAIRLAVDRIAIAPSHREHKDQKLLVAHFLRVC